MMKGLELAQGCAQLCVAGHDFLRTSSISFSLRGGRWFVASRAGQAFVTVVDAVTTEHQQRGRCLPIFWHGE